MTAELTAPAKCAQSYDGEPLPVHVVLWHEPTVHGGPRMSEYDCNLIHVLHIFELDLKLTPGSEVEGLSVS